MKLITLNTWEGRAGHKKLLDFFEKYKKDVDIFCLQEISAGHYDGNLKNIGQDNVFKYGMQEISKILSNYKTFFHPHYLDNYGLMLSIKSDLEIRNSGEVFVHKHKGYIPEGDIGNHARNIQYVTFLNKKNEITVINFHGLWNGKGKTDSKDRLDQSNKIVDFIKRLKGKVVLCGDFNLLPDTKSLKALEDIGLRNLISEYSIKSTRTSFYTKLEKFADYIFISPDIKLNEFKVLADEVSDHSPLFLDFE